MSSWKNTSGDRKNIKLDGEVHAVWNQELGFVTNEALALFRYMGKSERLCESSDIWNGILSVALTLSLQVSQD